MSIVRTIIFVCILFLAGFDVASGADDFSVKAKGGGDSWTGRDKLYHFTVSAGLAFGSFYIYREGFNNNREGSYYFSGGFSVSVGAFKEYYDSRHPQRHHASWRDFAADLAGVCLGLGLAYLLIN